MQKSTKKRIKALTDLITGARVRVTDARVPSLRRYRDRVGTVERVKIDNITESDVVIVVRFGRGDLRAFDPSELVLEDATVPVDTVPLPF